MQGMEAGFQAVMMVVTDDDNTDSGFLGLHCFDGNLGSSRVSCPIQYFQVFRFDFFYAIIQVVIFDYFQSGVFA